MKLKDKHILITGAAGGIGEALAFQFTTFSAALILVDLDEEKLTHLKDKLSSQFPNLKVQTFVIDLTNLVAIEELSSQISELDILINNAGVAFGGPFQSMNINQINKTIEVNLLGAVNMTKLFLPILKKKGESRIVNVASGAGLVPTSGMVVYSASKHGLVGFSLALRGELKKDNVGVSVVCPAFVKTDLISNSLAGQKMANLDEMVQKNGVTPEKVAKAVLKAIKSKKAIINVGALTIVGFFIHRVSPALARKINELNYQKLLKQKVFDS